MKVGDVLVKVCEPGRLQRAWQQVSECRSSGDRPVTLPSLCLAPMARPLIEERYTWPVRTVLLGGGSLRATSYQIDKPTMTKKIGVNK